MTAMIHRILFRCARSPPRTDERGKVSLDRFMTCSFVYILGS
jgi:hypothetical protein